MSLPEPEQFVRYRDLLLSWNERMNLTAITDPAAIDTLHFADSLAGLEALPSEPGLSIVDVGSGAGLPGLALKIARPDLRLTLLEATRKKTEFLHAVIGDLALDGVDVLNARAEDVGRDPATRESWDVALARALAPLNVLAELCLPLVRVGGRVVAWKKRDIGDERSQAGRAVKLLGGQLTAGLPVDIPGLPPDRQVLVLPKVAPTPAEYPRLPGVPKQRPLR